MPIMERLYQKYGNNPQELNRFAGDIVTASGIFAEVDMNQINQKNDNTPAPELGKNILIKRILVNLPACKEPELMTFAEDLKRAIESNIGGGEGSAIIVDKNSPNQNEISVMTLVNGFPMRAISSVPMLQAEYNKLTAQDPKNKIILVSEGRDGDYRQLFARPAKTAAELREDFAPQLIVTHSLEKFIRDEASEEYGVGEKDFFGNAAVTPWGHRVFIEIPYDDRLVTERKSQMAKLYRDAMAEAFAEVDCNVRSNVEAKKKEIQQAIMTHLQAIMKEENPKKPQPYNDFVRWTQNAVKMVQEYKPEI
jgi:hypothetical protein